MLDQKKYTQFKVEPTKNHDQMKVDVKISNTQEFMLTTLLAIVPLAILKAPLIMDILKLRNGKEPL